MKQSKKKNKTFKCGRRGHIQETEYNSYLAYVYNHGIRERKCFKSFRDAESWILHIESGMELDPLTPGQVLDAQLAFKELPVGVTLREVVRDYLRLMPSIKKSTMTLSELLDVYVVQKHIGTVTARSYRTNVAWIISLLGDKPLHEYTLEEARSCITEISQRSLQNGLHVIKVAKALFSWAVKNDYVGINTWAKIDNPKPPETTIHILSVEDAKCVMRTVSREAPELVWYFAIGMFAGVRPKELERMTHLNVRGDYIYLDGTITKTKSTRSIKIADNLAMWLRYYPISKIDQRKLTRVRKLAARSTSTGRLPFDVMRHSFASYLYEMTHDANLVASELGHSTTVMLFKHYRALAYAGTGAEYFSISPE